MSDTGKALQFQVRAAKFDFFDVENDPAITFKSTKIVKTGHETYEVDGDFPRSIKSREADANGFRQGDGSGEIKGKMLFNRKDYGMNKGIAFYAPPQPNLCEGLEAPEQR
jgi:polyisoprenoid-binding protein YceI